MKPASPSQPAWLWRSVAWSTAWLFRHGQRPYAIWSLSTLCVLDGFVPMVPAEFIALALMVLQPRRALLVVFVFAVSAAMSAGLLATWVAAVAEATPLSGWLSDERQSASWTQALGLIQTWGAPALALAAVFPDSPRTSIAVAALAGMAPIHITGCILAGKLVLYGLIFLAWQYMPTRWPRHRKASWPGARHLQRALQRFAAWRRWVNRRLAQENTLREKPCP